MEICSKKGLHKNLLGDYEFYENWRGEKHNLLMSAKEFLSVISTFINWIG
jgi:hypothetical protein